MLAVNELAFGFRGKTVGHGFTFAVGERETLAILGPNGAGKTTLLRTLLGLLPIHSGSIQLFGKALCEYSQSDLARTVAYVPQAHDSYFPFRVRDVVLMGRTAHLRSFATPGTHDHEVVDAVMAEVGITHLAENAFDEISGGEQQLALIARALATEAKLFIMDEPTANLDYGNQLRMLDTIKRLRATGKAVLFCTHHPEHALQAADTVLMMRDGGVMALGTAAEVDVPANLAALFGVTEEEISAVTTQLCSRASVR